jgi:hypothetical protein
VVIAVTQAASKASAKLCRTHADKTMISAAQNEPALGLVFVSQCLPSSPDPADF